ncbi:unnamed protein product [Coregonus sp. 'balchen']|nr:unnamed protein product [Coregonus sp. 'balchen']
MLVLSNTEKAHYGKYDLNIYNSEGILLNTTPVSSPQLSSQCLSHGEMMVTCSSEGQSPVHQYSWTDRH